ncbi:MAG: glycerophosphodiester phosphodiesterase family protein [Hyphomicrobiales bacterium]
MTSTKIVCHRGARFDAPENTFSSAQKAIEIGGAIIELDIRQSSDGVLYVMHDETVDRTTNGSGAIAELTSMQIDALDAGSWHDPTFAGERVPRLDAFLGMFADRAGFYLEVKKADCSNIAKVVRKLGIAEQCFTFSFDPEMRRQMHVSIPEVRRMIHWNDAGSAEAALETHHASIVEFHQDSFTAGRVKSCQAHGLEVMFYSDKPDEENFQTALDLEMNYVNIDYISLFSDMRVRHENLGTSRSDLSA